MGDLLRRILEEHQGQFVSGREIGSRLGMSRAAVWKRVQSLRRRGFGIEGARGAGYRLIASPDVIEEADLISRLARPSFWKSILLLPVTDSTNRRAAELAEKGAPHGTVVCADAQTAGRGRFGRRWESPPGLNLYVSLLLRPPMEPLLAPQLTLVTAIALAKAAESASGIPADLKWPNDLYLGDRKAAGILAEMSADQDRLRHVVIGAGLNVNADLADFPEELRKTATSLRLQAGRSFRRVEVLAFFLDAFAECFDEFLSGGFAALYPEWKRRSFLDGRRVVFRYRDKDIEGTVMGVDENGALLFRRLGSQHTERLHSGEIISFAR
ncbi:MAG: biotin--[acetyl-CoA-carboxylase] ligase [Deltaproteobacteria bacterium]|nr:biotin--[acetyl-CoA-carboxylase] ligase [Deltaproteobacteria bacterium]